MKHVTVIVLVGFFCAFTDAASAQFGRRPRSRAFDRVEIQRDIPYAATDNERQRLDLVLPKMRAADKPLPVIVFIHGGAWRSGNKSGGVRRVAPFVAQGKYAGVSVGYRLTGDAIWPAQIHDCKAAIRWIRGNADKYNLNPDRIAVWGSSAGGHLVAMLGVTGDVPALEGTLGKYTDQSSKVYCVIDEYGPTDFLRMNDFPGTMNHDSPNSPESILIGGAIQENKDKARAACPLSYVSKGDAIFLIIHGTDDKLVPFNQSELLNAALEKAGLSSTLVPVKGGQHGGFRSPDYRPRVAAFLRKNLLGEDVAVPSDPIREPPRQ